MKPENVIAILEPLIDEDECQFDHNHSCQTHGYFYLDQGELCPQEAAKRFLVALQPQSNKEER